MDQKENRGLLLHILWTLMRHQSYMQTEMMSDAIDDALDDDEAEEETDELTNQVLSFKYLLPSSITFSFLFYSEIFARLCISKTSYVTKGSC